MVQSLKFLTLTFTTLLPVINPIGSAIVLLGLVGAAPVETFRKLARKIAVSTVLFLLVIDLGGAAILSFFGVSLPVVQFAGGFVLAAMGWNLLNQQDVPVQETAAPAPMDSRSLGERIFYPFTFPVTAGPATIVVMLTLSAHAGHLSLVDRVLAHAGIFGGIILIAIAVYFSYAYAQRFSTRISRQTVHGILRVVAFILLCIGVQISWNGLEALLRTAGKL